MDRGGHWARQGWDVEAALRQGSSTPLFCLRYGGQQQTELMCSASWGGDADLKLEARTQVGRAVGSPGLQSPGEAPSPGRGAKGLGVTWVPSRSSFPAGYGQHQGVSSDACGEGHPGTFQPLCSSGQEVWCAWGAPGPLKPLRYVQSAGP